LILCSLRVNYISQKEEIMQEKCGTPASIDFDEVVMTADEVVECLRISKPTLWRLRDRGQLPCFYYGTKMPRWRKSDVERFRVMGASGIRRKSSRRGNQAG
jgi:predicted DNA-binding transcriptional regulator AlpA